jgi:hypothetical protein
MCRKVGKCFWHFLGRCFRGGIDIYISLLSSLYPSCACLSVHWYQGWAVFCANPTRHRLTKWLLVITYLISFWHSLLDLYKRSKWHKRCHLRFLYYWNWEFSIFAIIFIVWPLIDILMLKNKGQKVFGAYFNVTDLGSLTNFILCLEDWLHQWSLALILVLN